MYQPLSKLVNYVDMQTKIAACRHQGGAMNVYDFLSNCFSFVQLELTAMKIRQKLFSGALREAADLAGDSQSSPGLRVCLYPGDNDKHDSDQQNYHLLLKMRREEHLTNSFFQ